MSAHQRDERDAVTKSGGLRPGAELQQVEDRRWQIDEADRVLDTSCSLGTAGFPNQQRNVQHLTVQGPTVPETTVIEEFLSVIGGHHQEASIQDSGVSEIVEKQLQHLIRVCDGAVVLCAEIVPVGPLGLARYQTEFQLSDVGNSQLQSPSLRVPLEFAIRAREIALACEAHRAGDEAQP
jgi:hypothetical protein